MVMMLHDDAGGHGGEGGLTESGVWKQNHTALIREPEEQG